MNQIENMLWNSTRLPLCFEVKIQDLFAFFIFTHSLFDSIVLQIAGWILHSWLVHVITDIERYPAKCSSAGLVYQTWESSFRRSLNVLLKCKELIKFCNLARVIDLAFSAIIMIYELVSWLVFALITGSL